MRETIAIGKIKRIKTETGIGFIQDVGKDQDILFHAAALIEGIFNRLSEGQRVQFDHKVYPNAPSRSRAINVRPLG